MTRQVFSGPPTPDEFQRRLQELMRQHFNPSNLFGQAKQAMRQHVNAVEERLIAFEKQHPDFFGQ